MKKFRLIKETKTNVNGEQRHRFIIESKKRGKWKTHEINRWIKDSPRSFWGGEGPWLAVRSIKRDTIFSHEEDARKVLDQLQNPFQETYKDNQIEKGFTDDYWNTIYINKSFFRTESGFYGNTTHFEFAASLDELKKQIDSRDITTERYEL